MFLLMIINDLHVRWAEGVFGPFKASPPLIIDANAALALPVPSQRFKTIAGQYGKVFKHDGRLRSVQPQTGGAFDSPSIPKNVFTRLPAAKSLVRLSR
jgi:hypothetical protein